MVAGDDEDDLTVSGLLADVDLDDYDGESVGE